MPIGRQPRGVPPHLRSGAAARVPGCDGAETAKRSYPTSEVRGSGQEEPPRVRGQGRCRGQEWCPRPGVVAGRNNPMPKEW